MAPFVTSNRKTLPRFSRETLQFLLKAGRQKKADWLDCSQEQYRELLLAPLLRLAKHLQKEVLPQATGYHFPGRGIGRIKRPANRVADQGGSLFKNWISYSASRPAESRFEKNPSLLFLLQPEDQEDSVLVAGGLYMPTSRQLKAIRSAIANDATPFTKLFQSKAFKERFPGGFSLERVSTRVPRGFNPNHPKLEWLKLQGYYVWRSYPVSRFATHDFFDEVALDWLQALRLNQLLMEAIQKPQELPMSTLDKDAQNSQQTELSIDRWSQLEPVRRQMDF